jgi:hypothetical protein
LRRQERRAAIHTEPGRSFVDEKVGEEGDREPVEEGKRAKAVLEGILSA